MGAPATQERLTYADLEQFPDDGLRREIIDGVLYVTPSPVVPHQRVVVRLVVRLAAYADEHGGLVLPAPADVYFTESDVVEPDVLYVGPEHNERILHKHIRGAPDLVVEVSSPGTRHRDLGIKRDLYEAQGVAEYWFVDLRAEAVEVWRLGAGGYGDPLVVLRGDTIAPPRLPGFTLDTEALFAGLDRVPRPRRSESNERG